MTHFGSGAWNNPCGPVFRRTITNFGPTSGNATTTQITNPDTAAETALPTSYKVQRTGLYVAYISIRPSSDGTASATVKGGVTYTNLSAVNKDLTDAAAWTTAAGGTTMLATTPFEAVEGSSITFYYTTTGNSGSHQNLTANLMLRAL